MNRGAWMALSFITGLLMIVLGGLFIARPGYSLATVIALFGWFAIVYGAVYAVAGLFGRGGSRLGAVLTGLLAVAAGVLVLVWPGLTALTLLYLIAGWAIVSGLADVVGAFAGGMSGGQRAWAFIAGALSVVAGIVLFVYPASGALAILWLIGAYLVALGLMRIVLGFMPPPPQTRVA